MRKISIALLSAIMMTTSIAAQTIKGVVKNASSETKFSLRTIGDRPIQEIPIENGSFLVENLKLKEGFYLIRKDNSTEQVYLKPTDELIISFDAQKFDETLSYAGEGSEANNYLVIKGKLQLERKKDTDKFYEGNENDYKKKILALQKEIKELLAEVSSKSFKKEEEKNLRYGYLFDIYNYPNMMKFNFGKKVTVPKSFFSELKGVNFDNAAKYLKYPNYKYLAGTKWKKDVENARSFEEMSDIMQTIRSKHIFVDVIINSFYRIADTPEKSKMHFDLIKKFVPNEAFIKEAKAEYEKVKATSNGKKAPNFKFNNRDGKSVELASFKGKYVLIDIWATWCVPCLKQVPYLKKLEKKYHDKNIVFVGISVDDKDEYKLWKETLDKKEMGGVQLFADKSFESDFVDAFGVASIPRFILISPEGIIVESHFSKPSHKVTEERLDALLK
ncbi:TlpA disulfide reductase family protein [Tenacibaculum sp. 190524A05c]|uniref:Cytochrome c biogenesis protein CcmG, thiol:disulfide interchange protein DsbE n=1 Tax=Tenacibaculum platacis TaxID=3137852 RepID=A0ABM9NVJ8_9FLAO